MKIAFDIDGVIANSESAIRSEFLDRTGHDITHLWKTFNFEVPGYNWVEVYDMIQDSILYRSDEITPHDDAISALYSIYEHYNKKYPITFITARPEFLQPVTKDWMKKYMGNIWHDIIYTSDKCKYLKEHNFEIFVEDRLKTANGLSKDMSAIFLVNRPWNEGRDHAWNVIRVNSVNEAVERFIRGMDQDFFSRDMK